jgi:hypothetical protein
MSATKKGVDGKAVNPKLAPISHACDRLYAAVFEQVKAKAIIRSTLAKRAVSHINKLKPEHYDGFLLDLRFALAEHLATIGAILPVIAKTKRPAIKEWEKKATQDPIIIREWARRFPDCNWGIGDKNVGDVDSAIKPGNTQSGLKTFTLLVLVHGEPDTLIAVTPTGGEHIYITDELPNGTNTLGIGIDSRAARKGYVLAPGSYVVENPAEKVGETGFYKWKNDRPISSVPWLKELAGNYTPSPERGDEVNDPEPGISNELLAECLGVLDPVKFRDQEKWFRLMCSCHDATAGAGFPEFDDFSHRDNEYGGDNSDIETRWNSLHVHTAGDLKMASDGGLIESLREAGRDDLVAKCVGASDFPEPPEPLTQEQEGEQESIREMNAATPSQGAPRVVLAAGTLPKATRQVKIHLIDDSAKPQCPASDKIFRRGSALGSALVHLNRNELSPQDKAHGHDDDFHVADDLMIRVADRYWLGDRAERSIRFFRPTLQGLVPADAPDKLLQRLGTIITRRDFPPLHATTETPTLRKDRSLLDKPGYDRKSGLFYDPGRAVFPPIPDRPTKEDARNALALFIGDGGILSDFPFTDEPGEPQGLSRAVALSMLLTSVSRRTLATAPGFGVDAYEAQSGKTLLAELAAIMATGRKTAERPWPTDEYQRSTALAAALEAGDAVLLYDNVDVPLESAIFCGAITEERIAVRRLGGNSAQDQIVAPTNALIVWTGNHLIAQGDMAEGRVLITRIVPDRELTKRKFQHRDLAAHVMEHRPHLVAAALTILRGYAVAKDKVAPTGFRHHGWGDLVGASVEWLGLPNPTLAEKRAQAADPVREIHNDVVRAWAAAFGEKWVTVNELIGRRQIAKVIAGAKGIEAEKLTFKTAVPFLREMIGLPRLGFKVETIAGDKYHPARWRLNAGAGAVVMGEEDQQIADDAVADFADDPV